MMALALVLTAQVDAVKILAGFTLAAGFDRVFYGLLANIARARLAT
jgi:hypothetical protein